MNAQPAPTGRRRIWTDLLLGACIGGIGAALVWHFYPGFWREPDLTLQAAIAQRQALQAQAKESALAQQRSTRVTAAAVAEPPAERSACAFEPLLAPGSARDGHATVEHPFPAGPRSRAKVFLRAARAAEARGRPRDAEVALIASCRAYEEASHRPNVPLARVLGMLGERYAAAATDPGQPEALREQLLARARQVLGVSAANYATALGPNASKSRQARERLARLDQDVAVAGTNTWPSQDAQAGNDPVQSGSASAWPLQDAVPVRAPAPAPAPPPAVAAASRGGMDAFPGRERPERESAPAGAVVASDPELRQLASDLARLRAQVQAVTADPAGFRRRAEAAQARRDQCRDAACLRAWYADRRQALIAEF